MHFSNINCLLLAVAAAQVANAHTRFTNFFVDDVNQGDGTCVRMSNIKNKATNPVKGITTNDMACGKNWPIFFTCSFPLRSRTQNKSCISQLQDFDYFH